MDLYCMQLSSSFSLITPFTATFPRRSRLSAPFHPFFYPNPVSRDPRLSCIPPHFPCIGVTRCSGSATLETTPENADPKVNDTVFVAGATGKVGSRTVRELLKVGFQVRAGVRTAQKAQTLIQSVREMNIDTEDSNGVKPIEKLEIVECDLEKRDQILPAIGCSSVVICCIGASEKEIFDVTGPFRIDYKATKNLIDAARVAKVNHFILLTSLGTNKIGFPAAILNLFWGVLIWKRKAEEELIASGLPYTIVRPGGMERPTDSYKETHNITLSEEDTLFGGQVSNLQVAELMAVMAQNPDLSYCKIVEVVAETTAPLIPMADLLAKIPSKREYTPKTKKLDVVPKPVDPEPAKSSINKAEAEVPKLVDPKPAKSSIDIAEAEVPKLVDPEPAKSSIDKAEAEVPKLVDPKPAKSSIDIAEADVGAAEAIQVENVVAKPNPLSPYTAYDDLKPPSSPTPTAPNGQRKEIAAIDTMTQTPDSPTSVPATEVLTDTIDSDAVKLQKPQSLSPYPAYEDLKPPSSPSPSSPSNTIDKSARTPKVMDGVPKVVDETLPRNDPRESTFYHSPFPVYEDLRPPTSPTPIAPNSAANKVSLVDSAAEATSTPTDNGVEPSISPGDGIELVTAQSTSMDEQNPPEPKPRPLSPYTMYDDMKPPSSPMPSPKIH